MIGIITLIADNARPTDDRDDDTLFPNMGVYKCFLGYRKQAEPPSFVENSHFLYFQADNSFSKHQLMLRPKFHNQITKNIK